MFVPDRRWLQQEQLLQPGGLGCGGSALAPGLAVLHPFGPDGVSLWSAKKGFLLVSGVFFSEVNLLLRGFFVGFF